MGLVFLGAKAFLGYPRLTVEVAATAGWMVSLVGGVFTMGVWLVIVKLLSRFPGKSLVTINMEVLGPFWGLMVNVLFLIYFLIDNGNLLRLFSEAVILTTLPRAPLSSLTFLFIIPVIYAAYQGLEAISRSTNLSLPYILFGVLAVLVALYPFWDIKLIYPLLGYGVKPILQYGALNISAFSDVILLAYLVPYISFDAPKLGRIGLTCITIVTIVFILIILVYLMVLPLPSAVENVAPFYQLSRTIFLGRYFQRVESVFILFWTFTAYLRLSIGLLLLGLICQETLRLKYYRPLLPALGILLLALALTPTDFLVAVKIQKYMEMDGGGLIPLVLALLIWLVAVIKKRGNQYGPRQE